MSSGHAQRRRWCGRGASLTRDAPVGQGAGGHADEDREMVGGDRGEREQSEQKDNVNRGNPRQRTRPGAQPARLCRSSKTPEAIELSPSSPERYHRMKAASAPSGSTGGGGELSALSLKGSDMAWSCCRRQSAQPARCWRTANASRAKIVGRLLGWTRARHRSQIDLEVGLRKEPLVGDRGHFRDERPASVVERLSGLSIAIGTVSDSLFNHASSVLLAGFDHGQRLVMIRRIAR